MSVGLKSLLSHPLTKGFDLDDPQLTERRVQVIQSKPFLRRLYQDWYRLICRRIPAGRGSVLELGSGAGFLSKFVDGIIQSDVLFCPNVDLVADARDLPFLTSSLKAIVMTDVFHHIPRPEAFLSEATRCLRPGGRIVMIEPWVSPWSRLILRPPAPRAVPPGC